MFDNGLIDVCIGLITLYLVLSVICSALQETISSWLGLRAKNLSEALENMLGQETAGEVYANSLIQSFVRGSAAKQAPAAATSKAAKPGKGPSYIDPAAFRKAIVGVLDKDIHMAGDAGAAAKKKLESIRLSLDALPTATPHKAHLLSALNRAETVSDDATAKLVDFESHVEDWFDSTMERASGWYKRRVQFIILIIGAALVLLLDADTVRISRTLWDDHKLQSAVYSAGSELAKNPDLQAEIVKVAAASLPLGYECKDASSRQGINSFEFAWYCFAERAQHGTAWVGWLLTVIAITFGAPFWYGLLNKVVALKSAGGKPQTGQERRQTGAISSK